MTDPLLDTIAGSYRLVSHLGSGGVGEVYKAVHESIGSRVAIKVLAAQFVGNTDVEDRFLHEAQLTNRIEHDSIVKIIDTGRLAGGAPFLVMELLDGTPLDRARDIGDERACAIVIDVLDALAAAHAVGVVHRDLKPGNIFLTRSGRTVVLDFGLGKLVQGDVAARTVAGTVLGTPRYMAPEQVRAEPVGPAADLYAAGAVLFELLCNRAPFEGDTAEVERKHLEQRPPPPRALRPEIPVAVQDVVLAALAKDPARRPASAAAMRDALRAALVAEAQGAPTVGRKRRIPRPGEDDRIGKNVGGFVLKELIGSGGFGAVYRAVQPGLDRESVVKLLHRQLGASANERFLREAKLASSLDHPYAAHVYAFGAEPDGELWIAMELVRGTPLDRLLAARGPLPLARFVPLFDRMCEVVHTAHEQGIVHRDLKPANVMVLSRAGRLLPKLLDFGIAKLVVDDSPLDVADTTIHLLPTPRRRDAAGLTERGSIVGSPPYMAPEQWVHAGRADARTDLYALAIVAYECLVGKPPFQAASMLEMEEMHKAAPMPPLPAALPAELGRVLAKALAKQPEARYADALALAAAVRAASGVAVEAPSVPTLDPAIREAITERAPQPIAEAVAALESAHNAYELHDAIAEVAGTLARFLGTVTLAARAHVPSDREPPRAMALLRELYRRPFSSADWLELARELTRAWTDQRDAYPVPELVDACHDGKTLELVAELAAPRPKRGQDKVATARLDELREVLAALAFVSEYPLVVPVAAGVAELWSGIRRPWRPTVNVRGELANGQPALLDASGTPLVVLAPLACQAEPSPGAPPELFLFDGRDGRGARFVASPTGFDRHDDEVWNWLGAQLASSLDIESATLSEERAPYRGLSAFTADDADQFFGREQLVDTVVNRLKTQPLLAVVGRSGAGKSSFIHAGVVPALGWRAISLRPGPSPLASLAARLEHAGIADAEQLVRDGERLGAALRADALAHGPIVLVVDQLEELFTLVTDNRERFAFAEAIVEIARTADDPVRVVLALRDDFLLRAEQVPALRNRIGQGLQLLAAPTAEDLVRILVEPARRVGYQLEAGLAEDMVREVADQPGALPLISFTANKLWDLRDRQFKQLTLAAYKRLGGVGRALAHHADATLEAMPLEERAVAREAFRHLVTSQNTRAVVARRELRQLLGGGSHADGVVERLIAARLLVASENEAGEETIEIVHEALLATWPRLVQWNGEDAAGARFREQLRAAAAQWDDRGRAKGLLWRGDALTDLARWRASHTGPLTDVEAAFVGASQSDAARGRRNRGVLVASAFGVLVAGVVALVWQNARVVGQRARAEVSASELQKNLLHEYEDQGRRLVLDGEPLLALAYLAKAAEFGASNPAHDFLVAQAIRATSGERFTLHHAHMLRTARFSHDGRHIVTAGVDLAVRVWDASDGHAVAELALDGEARAASYLPDDRTILVATKAGALLLWDPARSEPIARFTQAGGVKCLDISRDGTRAVTGGAGDWLTLWQLPEGTELRRFDVHGAGTCKFSSDGTLIAAGDNANAAHVWSVNGELRRDLVGHKDVVWELAFSPDGSRVATTSADHTAIVWDTSTGRAQQVLKHGENVGPVVWTPDGHTLITGVDDSTVAVWDVATGVRELVLAGHGSEVNVLALSPDARLLATASEDTNAILWEMRTGRPLARWRDSDGIMDIAFDPIGRFVVTASRSGSAMVFAASAQDVRTRLPGHAGGVWAFAFSPDGRRVVAGDAAGAAIVSDVAGQEQLRLVGHSGWVTAVRFSPDGKTIATAGKDGTVRLWDASSGAERRVLARESDMVRSIAWSPDGTTLVAAAIDGSLRAWDVDSGKQTIERHETDLRWVTYAPNGQTLATVAEGSGITLRDARGAPIRELRAIEGVKAIELERTGKRILALTQRAATIIDTDTGASVAQLVGHGGLVEAATWSPDGEFVATASDDGTARLWSARDGRELAIWRGRQVWSAAFSPDGTQLALGYIDGTAELVELPRQSGGAAALARVLACRVPYRLEGDQIVHVAPDPSRCAAQ